ncbi:MAG: radical SAM protein [Pseudomonadales bacterium]|nr:radical SAM protein [Pseudomonadales bacterium]
MINLQSLLRKLIFRSVNWISRKFFASRLSYSHIEAFIFCNSFKKLLNFLLVHYEKARGIEILKSYPYLFVFEVTNVCNLKCPFCLTGKGISGDRAVRHVTFEEAKKIIDEVGDYIYLLQLYTWGEPLLNKDIYKIIEYAKSKRIFVMISTNATVMNEKNNQKLIDSGIDYVMVAIDGGSQETYPQYRVGGNYNQVFENLSNLLEMKKKSGNTRPFVEWQFIVFRHNEHEVEETEKIAYEIGINKFTPLPAYVEDKDWLPQGDKYKVEAFNPERLMDCDRPWTHLNYRADGGIASCCYEFYKKDDFGEAIHTPFSEIWNNEFFRESRKLIVQKRRGKTLDKSDLICYDCLESGLRPSFIESPTETQTAQKIIATVEIVEEKPQPKI